MKLSKIFIGLSYIAFAMLFAWFMISYHDVLAHQNCGGTDAAWNFFNIMI